MGVSAIQRVRVLMSGLHENLQQVNSLISSVKWGSS